MANLTTLSTAYVRFNDVLTTPSTDLHFIELMVADGKICFAVDIYPTKTVSNVEKHNVLSFYDVRGSSSGIVVYTQEDGWIYDGFKNFRVVKYQEPTASEWIANYQVFLNWINQNVTVIEQTGEIQKIKFSSSQPFTLSTPNGEPTWSQIPSGAVQQMYGQMYMIANDSYWDGTTTISSELKDDIYIITLRCEVRDSSYARGGGMVINAKLQGLVLTGNNIKVEGNISSLILNPNSILDKVDPSLLKNYINNALGGVDSQMFMNLFANNVSIIDASDLICDVIEKTAAYGYAFRECSNLLNPPQLPVKSLYGTDYRLMFDGCISLTSTPELPSTELKSNCYRQMFRGCSSLVKASNLPATTLANSCYREMFSGCTNIKLSETQTGNYTKEFRIPTSGTGTDSATSGLTNMFANTGGTFTGTPTINTTYYLWEEPEPTGTNNIWLGNTKIAKAFVGNSEIASMWLGNVKIYEKGGTPSGYTIYNNNFNWQYSPGNMGMAGVFKFKINGAPTDDNDYDYFIQDRGYGLQPVIHQRVGSDLFGVDKIPTIENVETIYYWGQAIQGLSINNNTIIPLLLPNTLTITYDNSYTYTLDSDITSIVLTLQIYD